MNYIGQALTEAVFPEVKSIVKDNGSLNVSPLNRLPFHKSHQRHSGRCVAVAVIAGFALLVLWKKERKNHMLVSTTKKNLIKRTRQAHQSTQNDIDVTWVNHAT